MKSNEEYWKERFTLLNEQLLEQGEQYNKKLAQEYDKASNNIQKEIEVFYARFAVNNLITFVEAKRIMNSDERKIFQMELKEYIEKGRINALNQKWIKELENASTIYRTDHLKALKIKIRQQVELLEATKEKELKSTLVNVYEEGYYRTAYEVQKGIQAGLPVAALDTNQVEKVLAKPWTADGRTFSAKIWGNDRVNLINQLETKLSQAFIKGEAPEKLIKDIVKTMQVSKSAASRLVMTESAFFASASRLDSYKAIGIEKFQILSALDNTTCGLCGSLDGKVISLSEYMPGTTAPPFHPWCRCTTIPYFKDEFTTKEKRLARGEDGKAYKAPGDMTYQQWKEKYASKEIKKVENIKIKNADKVHGDIMQRFTSEMDLIPESHRHIIEKEVKEIEFVRKGNSKFDKETGIMYLREDFDPGTVIHEMGHAIERNINIYRDDTYRSVVSDLLEGYSSKDIIFDPVTFEKAIYSIECSRFVSEYQGRLYEEVGLYKINNKINPLALGDYFSEGYREYIQNPSNLMKKDIKLYNYIKENLPK